MARELRAQCRLRRGDRLALAVSGGKDSIAMLHTLRSLLGRNRGVEMHVITVDEGIQAYRPGSLRVVESTCAELDMEWHPVSLKDAFGVCMDEVVTHDLGPSPCTFCGVLRRRCMDSTARGVGARVLAVGMNADDTAQSVLMNLLRNDLSRLIRMAPHTSHRRPEMVPRAVPLRSIPENENLLYVLLNGFAYHDATCPYSTGAMRNLARDLINTAEDRIPGTKFALIRLAGEIKSRLSGELEGEMGTCEGCGSPARTGTCKVCELLAEVDLEGKDDVRGRDTGE